MVIGTSQASLELGSVFIVLGDRYFSGSLSTCLVVCQDQLIIDSCLKTALTHATYDASLGRIDKRLNMVCVETSCSRYGARVGGITAATSAPWIVCCCCMLPAAPLSKNFMGENSATKSIHGS
jgi:hypothetical protein